VRTGRTRARVSAVRTPRFRSALVLALVAHASVALGLSAVRTPNRATPIATTSEDELVLVTEEPITETPPAAVEPTLAASRPPLALARASLAPPAPREYASSPASGEPATDESVPGSAPAPAPAPSAHAVDLGIGTYWKSVALGSGLSSSSPSPVASSHTMALPSPEHLLREALDAHDRALGLGSEGPLVSAAHEAASPALAPDVGSATLEIECDGSGGGITARVVSATGNAAAWNGVARELVRLVSSKRLHVPPGARGVRTTLSIVAEKALPAGEKRISAPGAVPDDVPQAEPVCDGEGLARRCVGGMPLGTTQTIGDLSNIGARRSRIVHVRVLGETTL